MPSIVTSDPKIDLASTAKQDVIPVSVNGADFLVGRGVIIGQEFGADFSDSWYRTPKYEALTLGSIYDAGLEDIEMLVLGLPVSLFLQKKAGDYLKEKYAHKTLQINGKSFSIGEVSVLPQPLGSYLLLGQILPELNKEFERVGRDPIESTEDLVGMPIMVMDPGQETGPSSFNVESNNHNG